MKSVLRRRLVRVAFAFSAGAACCALVVGVWAWRQAVSTTCTDVTRADLTLEDLISLRQRLDQYQQDRGRGLRVSAAELSMVLRDKLDTPIEVRLSGDQLEAELAVVGPGGCYNVDFVGLARVDHGVVLVVPERLVVGELDLSWWMRGVTLRFAAEDMPTAPSRTLLRDLNALTLRDGAFEVDVDDPTCLR